MRARYNTMLMAAAFVAACSAVAILPAGCQSTDRVCTTENGEVCPVCGEETRTQPLTGLKYTTCVCPRCGEVSKIDPATLEKVEDVFGYAPEFRATVCQGCGAIVRECATCRQAVASQTTGS